MVETQATPNNGKRKRLFWTVAVIGILGGLAILYQYTIGSQGTVGTQDAQVTGHILYVYPPAAGTLTTWLVHSGDVVQKGQTLGVELMQNVSGASALGGSAVPAPIPDQVGVSIPSPISGQVVASNMAAGSQVSPAGAPLAALVDTSQLWVVANIKETSISQVKVGEPASVTVDAIPGKVFLGHVAAIEPTTQAALSLVPDINTGTTFTKVTQRVPVKIVLDRVAGENLRAGLSCEVSIDVRGR